MSDPLVLEKNKEFIFSYLFPLTCQVGVQILEHACFLTPWNDSVFILNLFVHITLCSCTFVVMFNALSDVFSQNKGQTVTCVENTRSRSIYYKRHRGLPNDTQLFAVTA